MLGRSTCPLHLSNVHHRNIFLLLETESRDCNISDIYEQNKDHNSIETRNYQTGTRTWLGSGAWFAYLQPAGGVLVSTETLSFDIDRRRARQEANIPEASSESDKMAILIFATFCLRTARGQSLQGTPD